MPSIRATATATPRGDLGRFIASRVSPAVRAAVAAAGQAVLDEAKSTVPVRTGFLRDSGYVEVRDTDKTSVADVGFSASYASFIEFGTVHMPARSYLRSAMDSTRETVREIFRSQISLALK